MKFLSFVFLCFFFAFQCRASSKATFGKSKDPNEIDDSVFSCALDPDIGELYFQANQVKDQDLALSILEKIESVRPNCIDTQQSKLMAYGILNDMRSFRKTELRIKELKTEEENRFGKEKVNHEPNKVSLLPKKTISREPPQKEKINYWKWLFIYSVLKKKN